MDLLIESFRWLLDGIATIPVWPRSKVPALKSWKEFQTRLPTLEELARWFEYPRNIGIVTGWRNLVVIDFDELDLFVNWWDQHQPETRIVLTGRGAHVYFFCDEPQAAGKLPGIDIKAAGGYVLAPPSIHPSGAAYQVFCDAPIARIRNLESLLPMEHKATAIVNPGVSAPLAQYKGIKPAAADEPIKPQDIWFEADYSTGKSTTLTARIKRTFPITSEIDGPYLRRPEGTYSCHCPVKTNHKHGDRGMSAFFNAESQLFYCYVCMPPKSKGWDVITLYAKKRGLSDMEAILELQKKL